MYALFRHSWRDFRSAWLQYLTFEFVYSLMASIIFIPFLSYVFNRLLHIISDGNLLNNEVFSLGLTFEGILIMLCVSFLAVAVLFVEFGTLIILAEKNYGEQTIYISDAFLTSLSKLPRLIGLGFIPLIFLLLLVMPYMDISTLPPLLDINLTIFLTDILHDSWLAKTIYALLLLITGYLFVRWILVFHYIFIGNQSVLRAMISSWHFTGQYQAKVIWSLVSVNVLLFIFGLSVVKLTSEIVLVIDSKAIGDFLGNYLLTFSSYGMMLFTLIWIPINVLVLTRLFHQLPQGPKKKINVISHEKIRDLERKIIRLIVKKKRLIISMGFLILTGVFIVNYTINDSLVYLKWNIEIASHRGDMENAPENSISSIKNAMEKGVDAVEVDLAMTKDEVLILHHDADLNRVAGIPVKVSDLTYEEIKKIDIGKKYGENVPGEHIPTLEEVLELMTEAEKKLIIDMKPLEEEAGYADKVVELVEKYGAEELAYVQSFDNRLLQQIRQKNSAIKIGQVLFLSAGNLSSLDVDFYTVRQSMLTERFVKQARELNRDIWVWTVNIPRNMEEVLNYDIDGIITDYPERVQRVLGLDIDQMNEEE